MPVHDELNHSMVSFDDGHGIFRVLCSCDHDQIFLDREVEKLTGHAPSWVVGRLRVLCRERRAA
jgi:hypothetical protein